MGIMTEWDYRIVFFEVPQECSPFSIKEVFYDDDGKPVLYFDGEVEGFTEADLIEDLERYVEATNQPVLFYPRDFKKDE